jgi:isopentenyl diphosphate isomerase/L-lactate dehydrogenase-like FMN-dependent dehydrogenase
MMTAFDFEPVFRANLLKAVYDYTAHGGESEFTMRRNRDAFDWVEIIKPAAGSPATVSTAADILGIKMDFPIFVAPTASQGPLHPEGEMAMHAGASAARTTMMLSAASSHPVEKVAAAAPGPLWYQHCTNPGAAGGECRLQSDRHFSRHATIGRVWSSRLASH